MYRKFQQPGNSIPITWQCVPISYQHVNVRTIAYRICASLKPARAPRVNTGLSKSKSVGIRVRRTRDTFRAHIRIHRLFNAQRAATHCRRFGPCPGYHHPLSFHNLVSVVQTEKNYAIIALVVR